MNALTYHDNLETDLMCYQHDCACVDRAIQTLESMSNTQELLEASPEMGESSLRLIQQSVESFLRLGNIGDVGRVMPSVESFTADNVSLEGLAEGVKNVFMSIVNAIKKAFQWMWGMIKRLFGRNKDRSEKIETLEDKAASIEETAKNDPEAASKRTAAGWLKEVNLKNTDTIKKLVWAGGLLTAGDMSALANQLLSVVAEQGKHVNALTVNLNRNEDGSDIKPADIEKLTKPPLPETKDAKILKAVGADNDTRVFASYPFGDCTYVVVVDKKPGADMKEALRIADSVGTRKVKVGEINYDQFLTLKDKYVDGNELIKMCKLLDQILQESTAKLKAIQTGKEVFLKKFEALVKTKDAAWWSSREAKAERDWFQFQLKLFRKTMDEPAFTFYGMCDTTISAMINLTTYVLHFNEVNGNKMDLDEDGAKKERLAAARKNFNENKHLARGNDNTKLD